MHAKYCVIDGAVALVGSHNWSFGAFTDNREVSIVVRDTTFAGELAGVFEVDWNTTANDELRMSNVDWRSSDPGPRPLAPGPHLVVTSPAGLRDSGQISTSAALATVCAAAESTLDVEVNSISDRVEFGTAKRFGFVESLFAATARRGVSVRLLVDKWAMEHDAALLRRLDSVPNLAVRVIDIASAGPNPSRGTVHAKLTIADRRLALVGSATLSQRQVLECRNVGGVIADSAVVATLGRIFERDWFSTYSREP
jgi:phosphatidylserine/phosphatidylglycerophosphate/cardiolipin synthase-like enzyme